MRPGRAATVGLAALVVASSVGESWGQQRGRRGRPPRDENITVFVETSPTIANLFSRADEGEARKDWKFTIDCLQRVIDNPQGSLVATEEGAPQGGVLYESARQRAVRRVASLPPEGLSAYRLLFDGKAKRLLERGRAEHNPDDLWEVVHRYLLTRFGDDAVDLLASWALNAGQPNEVVRLLNDLLAMVPDADVPKELTTAKLAVAYALLGQTDKAWALMTASATEIGSSSPLERLGESLPTRLETVEVDPFAAWPVSGGSAARRGLMSAVKPTLVESVPWRYEMPDAAENAWRRVYHDDPRGRLILPTTRLVADTKRLFVRTPRGCVALDRNDLLERWRMDVSDVSAASSTTGPLAPRTPLSLIDRDVGFEDYVTADISLGFGLVTIVAREGEGDYVPNPRDKGAAHGLQWTLTPAVQRRTATGTQIIALDAETGRVVWQRGRTGHPGDPLGDVDFRSAPLQVAGRFWVPYFRRSDLYVAILDPVDGTLIDSVLLCSIGAEMDSRFRRSEALPPAASDGMVFVSSGFGILFGLNAYDYTLRWAGQYHTALTHDAIRGVSGPARWLPGPPVVAGDHVLIGAKESGTLLAFSGATGEFRWSAEPKGAAYIIGSDRDRVWVGGRLVTCLSVADGKPIWTAELPSIPTGRGVLAGDVVFVPMLDGLLSFDADSGDPLEYASLPADEDPPGNLLSLDHGLLTVGPSGIRRFPDIDRSYPIALAQYEGRPSDASLTIRLAWLELLRGEPQRAYDILKTFATTAIEVDPPRAAEAVRLRVEALLAIAQLTLARGGTDDDALEILIRAGEIARSAHDRLRCGLAIAHKLTTLGRNADAYRRLWDLGVSSAGQQIVPFGDHVSGMARFEIAQRLAETGAKLSRARRQELFDSVLRDIDDLGAHLTSALDPHDATARLRAIADLDSVGPVRHRATSEIAAHYIAYRRYESAEQLLRHRARSGADPVIEATNLVKICRLYALAVGLGVPAASAVLAGLDELETLVRGVTLPVSILGDDAGGTESLTPTGKAGLLVDKVGLPTQSVAAWAKQLRSKMYEQLGYDVRPRSGDSLELTGKLGWSVPARERARSARLVRIAENGPSVLSDRVFFQEAGNVISCLTASDGELQWKTTLRLPESFVSLSRQTRPISKEEPRRAVADGQTAVFRTDEGLFAVGLATGRMLWSRAFDATALSDAKVNPDLRMAAADGLLAAMPRDGRLALMRMLDGEIIWERDLRGEAVEIIRMIDGRVVTLDAARERVHIIDRDTGRLVRRVLFDQPDPQRGAIRLVAVGGILCGPAAPSGSVGIQGVDIATGEVAWQARVDKPVAAIFKLHEQYIGVGLLGGNVRIVDAATGQLLVEHNVPGAHVIIDGTLVDGTLIVRHFASRDPKRKHAISALDLATGEELWKRSDLVTTTKLENPLRVYGDRLFAATQVKKSGRIRRFELRFGSLDIRTGQPVGPETSILRANTAHHLNGDFAVYPLAGVVVVGTDKAILTLQIAPTGGDSREGM